ncbi:MAG: OsmC family protein [Candidatus Nanohaloarchaeota archaeon QJJ-7]|nr:OsmC family protein [Candidatus Nanohaloarchaeota archaeon QJJ-7]
MSEELQVSIESEAKTHTELDVSVRGHRLKVDEPEDFGGHDRAPNPLEYMFTGLAGCLNVAIHKVAGERDVGVESVEIDVEGDIDLEGFEDPESEKRSGFQDISIYVEMDTEADEETEEEILEEAEGRCPVNDNLKHGTDIQVGMR